MFVRRRFVFKKIRTPAFQPEDLGSIAFLSKALKLNLRALYFAFPNSAIYGIYFKLFTF